MHSFVKNCHCQGYPPDGVMSPGHVSRAGLVARLLRERQVSRFIVAPLGFGKTSLAFEYASMVFSFNHVFWMRGSSPCFLRDLDAGTFLGDLLEADPDVALVVWEDVPRLAPERAQSFTALINGLLEHGIEVLVTCTPACDTFSALQHDRTYLGSADVLLSMEEMRQEAASGHLKEGWEAELIPADRVCCLRWGDGEVGGLLKGASAEELPADVQLAMLLMLALVHGPLEDLGSFLSAERVEEAAELLEAGYPFFGIDRRCGLFHALDADPAQIAEVFSRRLQGLAEASVHPSRDSLCEHIADCLLATGRAERAAQFMGAFADKRTGARWLARQGWRILVSGRPYAFCALHAKVERAGNAGGVLSAMRGWASFMLGEDASARTHGRMVASSQAPLAVRLSCGVLGLRTASGERRQKAARVLEGLIGEVASEPLAANEEMRVRGDGIDWACLAAIAWALEAQPSAALGIWAREAAVAPDDDGLMAAHRNALLVAAAWIMDEPSAHIPSMGREADADGAAWAAAGDLPLPVSLDEPARFARDCLEHEGVGSLGWCAVAAGGALERLSASQPRFIAYLPKPSASARLHKAEVSLFEQRDALRQLREARQESASEFNLTHPDAFRSEGASAAERGMKRVGIPVLHVHMFGGLSISIGDAPVRPSELNRQKTRMLLSLLALNDGREMGRDRLAEMLWPRSDPKLAVKNFYSVWSQLRRALRVGEQCPYLIRTQNGCRLDGRLVDTDVASFERLCRSLLFGAPGKEDWQGMYQRVCSDFAEDLLPCEQANDMVNSLRERYRIEMVDALIAASKRLGSQGEPQGSLWFAREALRRDDRREDAYIALMEAQILSDQRTDALDTYFNCRQFLSEELGIDPSLHLMRLYNSVIASEEVMA